MKLLGDVPSVNLVVDGLAALVFVCLASTGFLMEFKLKQPAPPENTIGHAAGNAFSALTWLGVSRDDFEETHEFLSLVFVSLVVLHNILHRKWLWVVSRGQNPKWQRARGVVLVAFLGVLLSLITLALVVPTR